MTNRIAPSIPLTGRDDIGGAVVRRKFTFGGEETYNGQILTAEQVRSMHANNFRALRDNGYLQVFPKPRSGNAVESSAPIRVEPVSASKNPRPSLKQAAPEIAAI